MASTEPEVDVHQQLRELCARLLVGERDTGDHSTELGPELLEALFHCLFDHSARGMVLSGLDGRILLANDAAAAILGAPRSDLLQQSMVDLTMTDDRTAAQRALATVQDAAADHHWTTRLLRASGDTVSVDATMRPVRHTDGTVIALLETFVEHHDAQSAEEALRQSETRCRQLIDRAPLGILFINTAGEILDANHALITILGSPSIEATRKINMLSFPLLVQAGLAEDFRYCVERGEPLVSDRPYTSKWGKTSHLRYHLNPTFDANGNISGALAIVEDMSAMREAETQADAMKAQLQQTQKMESLGHLAGGIAHDMNNFLAVIMTEASTLRDELEDPYLLEGVDNILAACRGGRNLTHNLLGFSRKGRYARERVSLNEIIERTVQLLERTLPRNIEIVTNLESEARHVNGARDQLRQALMNICLNAADAMPHGGTLTITTRNLPLQREQALPLELEPGDHVELTVADSGEGMDAGTVRHAIDPFFTTKEQGKGTGLGLSMAYGTIRNHGGQLLLESELAKGTIVRWLLPALALDPQAEVARSEPAPRAVRGSGTVLLVDDEGAARLSGKRALQRAGYQVLLAEDGQQALEQYRRGEGEVDLVVLDLVMPGLDGAATFRELRKLDPDARVLIASGFTKGQDVDELLAAGALGFLVKPFTAQELATAVGDALR